ncbi:hypothetical protein KM043_016493 [Ampulex compressa]|nr:hypothetical protein KM043_016493 [Ampulex compressa]
MNVGMKREETRGEAKYLGVPIHTKLTFWPHKRTTMNNASIRRYTRQSIRWLLMSVTHSIMLYGVQVWDNAMKVRKRAKAMTCVQKVDALYIVCAYQIASENAVFVLVGVIPIDLLAADSKIGTIHREEAAGEERKLSRDVRRDGK